jgi:LytS/YehU family sensor histidine kinase
VRAVTWYLLIVFVSFGIKLLMQLRLTEQRAREIENAQLRTELSFLHAQINPHFLFNSLNTIYSLALKKSDTAPAAVLKLSHLLRYVIDDANRESVPLEQEVNYLNNYIELQKLRSTSSLTVNFNVVGNVSSTQIAPLLLLPFVENAFKYGISNHDASPIDILLERTQSALLFTVSNLKFEQGEKDSTGIGINNVKRRLELLYHGRYDLQIQDKDDSYFIKLTIQFT